MFDLALSCGTIWKRGKWIYLTEEDKFDGAEATLDELHKNTDLFSTIKEKVIEMITT